ncbi:MAG TPA: hypothetical protein VFD39_08940, partial [Trueperaceae bacterium]|nr:hypothetical protein [Trueperaceae bacterium]
MRPIAMAEAWAIWEQHPQLRAAADPELLRAATASAIAIGRMPEARALIETGLAQSTGPELECEFLSLQALLALH